MVCPMAVTSDPCHVYALPEGYWNGEMKSKINIVVPVFFRNPVWVAIIIIRYYLYYI